MDDCVLLRDRVFKVIRAGREIQRGLVSELHVKSRRAQAFDTLQDLLEAFVHGDDPQSVHDLPFRTQLDTDAFADNPLAVAVDEDAPLNGDASPPGDISYFRLFQSMHVYQQNLLKLERLEALDSNVFFRPGCLLELVGKTCEELQKSGREVFKWFLANEVYSLCQCAHSRRRSLVRGSKEREPLYTAVPETRWRELAFQLADMRDTDLTVWSPYLPRDLAGFIAKLQVASGADGLRVHLVPDRIEGRYLRTQWSDELSRMKADQRLTFYDSPVTRHASTDLCHAKLWKLPDKLAVGSWNFTGPGSNCLRDDQGDWSLDNNVEAGFIIDDPNDWREATGKPLDLGESDCATADLLDKEGLFVNSLPPFDLHISFDWHAQAYAFHGSWLGDEQRDGYCVRLPGVADAVPLVWNTRRSPEQPDHLLPHQGPRSPVLSRWVDERATGNIRCAKRTESGIAG